MKRPITPFFVIPLVVGSLLGIYAWVKDSSWRSDVYKSLEISEPKLLNYLYNYFAGSFVIYFIVGLPAILFLRRMGWKRFMQWFGVGAAIGSSCGILSLFIGLFYKSGDLEPITMLERIQRVRLIPFLEVLTIFTGIGAAIASFTWLIAFWPLESRRDDVP